MLSKCCAILENDSMFSYLFAALGETNEAFYKNIYTGHQHRQALRPHRPAPIPDIRLNQNLTSLPNLQSSSTVPSYVSINGFYLLSLPLISFQ